VIAVAGVGGAVAISSTDVPHEQEWVRALLQVGLIGVFGLVISVVLERFKDTLQQRRDTSKLRFDVLKDLSQTYMDVKFVRRKLQASKTFGSSELDELNQLQLQIELHKRVSIHSFRQSGPLETHLDAMEKYLNAAANNSGSPERSGFLSHGFRDFADEYKEAIAIIQSEIRK
jgi:hypothetical protein